MFRSLFDDGGQVTTSTVFHEDVENARIPVDVSVDVSYNVFVVKVFEDVSDQDAVREGWS